MPRCSDKGSLIPSTFPSISLLLLISSLPYVALLLIFPNITPKISPYFHLILEKSYCSGKLVQRMWLLRDIIPKKKKKHSYALTSFWFSSFVYFSKLTLLFWQAHLAILTSYTKKIFNTVVEMKFDQLHIHSWLFSVKK